MEQRFTLTEMGLLFSLEPHEKKMPTAYPKAQTLNFIKQFAYAYHAEKDLPLSLSSIILN